MPSAQAQLAEMQNTLGEKVRRASMLAKEVHQGQKRKTGEEYIVHPIAVAHKLFRIGADEDVVCAALLHDTLEDNPESHRLRDQIYTEFGDHVLYLVEAVSKNGLISDKHRQQLEYIEQIRMAFELDIFVFFIKVADLMDNMQTVGSLNRKRREQWVMELKYQYLPLFSEYFHRVPWAHREMYMRLLHDVEAMIERYHEKESSSEEGKV